MKNLSKANATKKITIGLLYVIIAFTSMAATAQNKSTPTGSYKRDYPRVTAFKAGQMSENQIILMRGENILNLEEKWTPFFGQVP